MLFSNFSSTALNIHSSTDKPFLTAIFLGNNGFIQSRRFTQDDIFQEWVETFNEVGSTRCRLIR